MSLQTLLPAGWPRPKGYANGVTARGRMVFVAGMVGWDEQGRFHSSELVPQVEQALRNIVAVLAEGGAKPEHIVRMTWYVLDKRAYIEAWPQIGRLFRELIGSYNAAMTAVEVSGLMEDQAQVEIEVTAMVPDEQG
jgi:enamine deaminase RidA (YjgF/YER057c/UK114 family)